MKKTLDQLASIHYGKDYKGNPKGYKEIPIYGTGGLMGYTSVKLNSGPAILSGRKGSINNPIFVEGDFWNVDTIFCVKPKEGIDPKWLYYNFLNTDLNALNEATGVPSVSSSSLSKLEFDFFSLPHQRKIAHILSTCDRVIEKTEAAIAKYEALKQGLMQDLFTRGIDVGTGALRPPREEAPELYEETDLGWLPKEWEVNALGEITDLITDGAHFSPIPQEEGLPIGNVKDMKSNGINYSSCTKILPEVFRELTLQNCSPKYGDILLSKDGTIGRVIHFVDKRPIVLLSSIAIIRLKQHLHSIYFSWVLRSVFFSRELYKLLSGSALKRITLKDINLIRLPYPKEVKEQTLIAEKLVCLNQKLINEVEQHEKYSQLKAGLMKDLLTGQVEVQLEEEHQA